MCVEEHGEVRAGRWAGGIVCTKDAASVHVGETRAGAHDGIGGVCASGEAAGRTHVGRLRGPSGGGALTRPEGGPYEVEARR
jgi:hypothetical protein